MDKEQLCRSLVKWIQTFPMVQPPLTVDLLSDGVTIAQILSHISTENFHPVWLAKIKANSLGNWRLKVSNLKKVVDKIVDYYQEVLGQPITSDFRLPDVNAIAENNSEAELGRLLQLVLGCAMNCANKQDYIKTILEMEEDVQHVVMTAIQELMATLEAPTISAETFREMSEQMRRLTEELQLVNEAKDEIAQRCYELDQQVVMLHEEKMGLALENEKLEKKLNQSEHFTGDSPGQWQLQAQVDRLKEEIYTLESSRDVYRIKNEELAKQLASLKEKYNQLQASAEDVRILQDEIDVRRENDEKIVKYEAMLKSAQEKLGEMSDLKRQNKLLEEKNESYVQQTLHLEEELKKQMTLKAQVDMYKKQVQELHQKLSDESKKADRCELERTKQQEKLETLLREKERLIAERDTLRETCEELKLTQLHAASTSGHDNPAHSPSSSANVETFEIIPPVVKEKLIRLEHENKVLKSSRPAAAEDQIQVLQTILDDAKERQGELETENRLANQRILMLESQLEESRAVLSENRHEDEGYHQKLKLAASKVNDVELELREKTACLEELKAIDADNLRTIKRLQEDVERLWGMNSELEERNKIYVEKAKNVIRVMEPQQQNYNGPEISALRSQLVEKDKTIENLMKESAKARKMQEFEAQLMTTAYHNLSLRLHRQAVDDRLNGDSTGMVALSFMARQRQATAKRMGIGVNQRSRAAPGSVIAVEAERNNLETIGANNNGSEYTRIWN